MADILERLRQIRIVPVIVIEDPDDALPLAGALMEGGLPCAEVTFRTPAAAESLRRIAEGFPDMLVGAGTVLGPDAVDVAVRAGAKFVVSPGFNPLVVDHALASGVPVFPGVCTPTEIEMAMQKGLRVMKFFPAEPAGGLPYLKAVSAPYVGVEFIPTGGIGPSQLAGYLGFRPVVACGGSWMVAPEWIRARDFARVRKEVANSVQAVRDITGEW
jgi:2-dehydro-3-deoxyphosphogluconate aldolase / (4S)-4-hydroxy-2-oxoglutarate aldolase